MYVAGYRLLYHVCPRPLVRAVVAYVRGVSVLALFRLIVLAVPLAWLGSELYGLAGLFAGIGVANLISGAVAGLYARREVRDVARELTPTAVPAE